MSEISLGAVIDRKPVGSYQVAVMAVCAAVVFLEGFDAQSIGYVAPAISHAWHLHPGVLGPVFGAGLFGLMLGALFIAPLADRVGRRPVILWSTLLFGVLSLATAWSGSVRTLLLLRFLTGFGLGGAMPNAIALTAEYSPRRSNTTAVMLMFNGFSLGSALGGVLAARLIPSQGWPSVFVVGGVLPLVMLPVLWLALPESIRFLVLAGGEQHRALRLLRRVDPASRGAHITRIVVDEPPAERMSVARLFRDRRAPVTLLLWLMFFMSLLDLYLLVNWLPTAIHAAGASITTAALTGALFQAGGIVGTVILSWMIGRLGGSRTLVFAYLLAALCIAAIGQTAWGLGFVMLAVFGAGFGVVGGQIGANGIAAAFYPTTIRATGVGWALGVGRVGSIVGPVVGGILLSMHIGLPSIFLLSVVPALLSAAAALALGWFRTAVVAEAAAA